MILTSKITEIFCSVDGFCQQFIPVWNWRLLAGDKIPHQTRQVIPLGGDDHSDTVPSVGDPHVQEILQ